MLDRYLYGVTERISPEAPVPVVQVQVNEQRLGAAANVAMNLAALGVQTTLAGCIGRDDAGQILQTRLQEVGIEAKLHTSSTWSTIEKWRILAQNQQLLRLDIEEVMPAESGVSARRMTIQEIIENQYDVLVLSDYDKGVCSDIGELLAAANRQGVPVLADPKFKNARSYRGIHLLKPNRHEFEAMVGTCTSEAEFHQRGTDLLGNMDLEALLVTRGGEGMTLFRPRRPPLDFPARENMVHDVTGAGDTVLAVLAGTLAAGAHVEDACRMANTAGAWAVRQVGCAPISAVALQSLMTSPNLAIGGVILSRQAAINMVHAARNSGERVVFTNGCFDILHHGHVHFLQQAKALGDRLLVAVNDDASTAANKGPGRPINGLAQRLSVLAGLGCVDWLVSFSEKEPTSLLQALQPAVLVKGGDYRLGEIVGFDLVTAYGGEVRTLDFMPGGSSSDLIARILGAEKRTESK